MIVNMAVLAEKEKKPIVDIVPIAPSGDIEFNDDYSEIIGHELEPITFVARLEIPDNTFTLPMRRDDGRLVFFPAKVIAGVCTLVLNFPTSGMYTFSNAEANLVPHEVEFRVPTTVFIIMRDNDKVA